MVTACYFNLYKNELQIYNDTIFIEIIDTYYYTHSHSYSI